MKVGPRTEPGFAAVGYTFEGGFREIAEVRVDDAGVPTQLFPAFASDTRKKHMQFEGIPGVTELLAFQLT